jgi:hypothetical protein
MSFLRYGRSIVRWNLRPGAGRLSAPLPASHRLDESQLAIPRRVALLQSPLLLHQPILSSRDPAGTVNQDQSRDGRIFNRNYAEFSAGVDTSTGKIISSEIALQRNGRFPLLLRTELGSVGFTRIRPSGGYWRSDQLQINYRKLACFGASLFWRTWAAKQKLPQERISIDLQPNVIEGLRDFLLRQN